MVNFLRDILNPIHWSGPSGESLISPDVRFCCCCILRPSSALSVSQQGLVGLSADQTKSESVVFNLYEFIRTKKMVGEDRGAPHGRDASSSPSAVSSSYDWKKRVFIPALVAGFIGCGTGLISKHRKTLGLANVSASYAANFAFVSGCYCGAREFVTSTRKTGPDDLLNSAIAGFGMGALLGRLQGGQLGAAKYSAIFAVTGTTADFAFLKLKSMLRDYNKSVDEDDDNSQKINNNSNWLRLPEWFPIQVLDEEALAAKRAREEKFLAQQARIRNLRKEES